MKKWIASAALTLCLALALLPEAQAAQATSGQWGALSWSYDQATCTMTITGKGDIPDISDVNPRPFSSYINDSPVEHLILGDGVTRIGEWTFQGFYDLTSVTIPNSVTSIGNNAFSDCSLTSITIPSSVTSIEAFAFYRSGLTSVTFESGAGSIGQGAFSDCDELASVTFNGNVDSIGDNAFYDCNKLTSVTFESGAGSIGQGAFSDCDELASVTFNGDVGSIGDNAFSDCDKLASVTFDGYVGSIGEGAFHYCGEFASVTFDGDVGSIGEDAFYDLDKLTSVIFNGDVGTIGEGAFCDCDNLTGIQASGRIDTIETGAFKRCDSFTRVRLPEVGTLQKDVFAGCDNLTALYIKSADQICDGAFDVKSLKDVYFGGTKAQWGACGGSLAVNDGYPVAHFNSTGLPDIEAGDKDTLLKRIEDGVGAGRTDVVLTGDIDLGGDKLTILKDCCLVLDLKGHKITSSAPDWAIDLLGDLTVLDSTVTAAPDYANGRVSYSSGSIETVKDAIYVQPGRTFTLLSGTVKAGGRGIMVYANRNNDNGDPVETYAVVESGYVEAEGSAVTVHGEGGRVDIDGGVFLSKKGTTIDGSEKEGEGSTWIYISRAVLVSQGAPAGHLPCGIYHPQDGLLSVDGTEIYARGGIGILMRGGRCYLHDSGSGSKFKPMRIYAGGSGKGLIGSLEAQAGPTVFLDQKAGLYDWDKISCSISQEMQYWSELRPDAAPADGYELRMAVSTSGINQDITHTERYSFGKTYTVTFDANGGEGGGQRTTDLFGKIQWPDDPTRPGYIFKGWSTGKDNLGAIIRQPQDHAFNSDRTLYAQWIPEGSYLVFFCNSIDKVKVTGIGGMLTDWPDDPTSLFGTFMGWYTQAEGGAPVPFDQRFTEDTYIYAHWGDPQRPHTITFHSNDGSGDTIEKRTDMDGKVTDWPADPERAGYTFCGWSVSKTYRFTRSRDYEFYQDENLYAFWVPNGGFTVTFHINDGSDASPIVKNTDDNGWLPPERWPADPVRTGYTFCGWYTDRDGGVHIPVGSGFFGNSILYAYWVKNGGGDQPGVPGGTTPGETTPGGTTPGGDNTPGGTTPGGDNTPGGTTPGGDNTPGGTTPGGDNTPGGTTPGGDNNPGGTTPETSRYRIYTPGRVSGGSFSVSHSSAAKGARITIELSPRSGYELDRLSVTDLSSGQRVRLTEYRSDTYTFTMPASDVELELAYYRQYTGSTHFIPTQPQAKSGPKAWYYKDRHIYHLTDGLVPDGTYLTRDMLISVLYNLTDHSLDQQSDIGGETSDSIVWATSSKILPDIYASGLWGTDKSISREQAVMLIFRYAGYRGCDVSQSASLTRYADHSAVRPIARDAMSWALAADLMPGASDSALSPRGLLTCGETGDVLFRFLSAPIWAH